MNLKDSNLRNICTILYVLPHSQNMLLFLTTDENFNLFLYLSILVLDAFCSPLYGSPRLANA